MDRKDIPLIKMLHDHKQNNGYSAHVPGHKNGLFFHPSLIDDFGSILPYDVTELDHLDDLHAPTGAIKEAQEAAARLYGAAETFFLVGGTTAGNLAMIYSLFSEGDTVFVQRNSHKSIFNALQLARVNPVLIQSEYDEKTNLPVGISADEFAIALKKYPEVKGIILTYPNYYGVSLPLKDLINIAKANGLYVLVDEAHAPHYQLGEPFPPSTLALGADVVVHSAHKMLPALTMSSFLHIGYSLNDEEKARIREALAIFQSSSPSYLLMASLDGARSYLGRVTDEKLHAILASIDAIKQEFAKIKQLELIDWELCKKDYDYDPLKVTMKTKTTLTGYELQQLFYKAGIFPEMADEQHVLLTFGLGVHTIPSEKIAHIAQLLLPYDNGEHNQPNIVFENKLSKIYYLESELRALPKRKVRLYEAAGQIAAESVIPYPPGIPLVISGEKITEDAIAKIEQLKEAGARFQGHEEGFEHMLVVKLEEEDE